MNRTILTALAIVLAIPAFSQKTKYQNEPFAHRTSIQGELFGHGLFYSVNLEHMILNKSRLKTSIQIGYAGYPRSTYVPNWIPVGINEIISFGKHHLEVGIGQVITTEMGNNLHGEDQRQWNFFTSGRLGYRYQKPNSHFVFRAGFTPLLEKFNFRYFHPSGSIAIGYCF